MAAMPTPAPTGSVRIVQSLDRRAFLIGSGLLASGALTLAACGGDSAKATSWSLLPRFGQDVLVPGTVRLAFSLGDNTSPLSDGPSVLTGRILDSNGKTVVAVISAKKRRVTEGIVYWDFHPQLDAVGIYYLHVDGGDKNGGAVGINDPSKVVVPYPGEQLPPFETPTTANTGGVNPICTRLTGGPCPFHGITLTDALKSGKPVAYLIGTPAHCQFGTCAPGLEFLINAGKRLGDKLAIVHAEVYTDDTATITTPAVNAYNLTFEPSLWLADRSGKIVTRLEGAWDQTELDEALNSLVA